MSEPIEVSGDAFDDATRSGRVVVDFWTYGCGACRAMDPVLTNLADDEPDIRLLKVNADAEPDLVKRFGVVSAPTLLVLENGEERGRLVGARSAGRLRWELEKLW